MCLTKIYSDLYINMNIYTQTCYTSIYITIHISDFLLLLWLTKVYLGLQIYYIQTLHPSILHHPQPIHWSDAHVAE